MAAIIETMEQAIVARLRTISYVEDARGVADAKSFLDVTTFAPPAIFVVFAGERAGKNEVIGATLQETTFLWKLYVIAHSFAPSAEGRLGTQGAYQMLEDVVGKLEGWIVDKSVTTSKMLLVGSQLYNVQDTSVAYEMTWRCNFIRQAA